MYNATSFDDLKNHPGVQKVLPPEDFKIEPQQWVQFADDDEPKKHPITDFVTPSTLDSDMHHSLALHKNQFSTPLMEEVNTDFFPKYVNPLPRYEPETFMKSTTSLVTTPRIIQIAPSGNFSEDNEKQDAYNC